MPRLSADDVAEIIQKAITSPDERDRQTRIGPSALGKRCEYCLGRMMLYGDEPNFNHYAWVGTSIHHWLEDNVYPPVMGSSKEMRVKVGEIPGYGPLRGTADLYIPPVVTDYKTSSKKGISRLMNGYVERGSRLDIIDPQLLEYYVQVNAYGLGVENLGHEVEEVVLYFIPRDGASIRDHRYIPFEYNPAVVHSAIERAAEVYAWAAEHGIEGLEADPECWDCLAAGRIK